MHNVWKLPFNKNQCQGLQLRARCIFLVCLSGCLSSTLHLFFTILVPTSHINTIKPKHLGWQTQAKLGLLFFLPKLIHSTFVLRATASLRTRYATDQKVIKQPDTPPEILIKHHSP